MPTPAWIKCRGEVHVGLFPVKDAIGQRTGGHDVDHQRSMRSQPFIEGFQMLHRGEGHLEQGAVAATQFVHLQYFRGLLGAAGF